MLRLSGVLLALSCLLAASGLWAAQPTLAQAPHGVDHQQVYGLTDVPVGLNQSEWQDIVQQVQAKSYELKPFGLRGYQGDNAAQGWHVTFEQGQMSMIAQDERWQWGLRLRGYGYAGHEQALLQPHQVNVTANQLRYQWDGALVEQYDHTANGLKQTWTLRQRPPGDATEQSLQLQLQLSGNLAAQLNGAAGLTLQNEQGQVQLYYGGLYVHDARGQTMAAHFQLTQTGLTVVVAEEEATYPLTIDPLAQQAYLKASNTDAGDEFGMSVALSGNTAIVGAWKEDSNASGVNGNQADNSLADAGAAYIFVRNGTTWTQQAYLKASNPQAGANFGYSVAVLGDTALIGAHNESNVAGYSGAAYVFVRSGSTWSQQAYLKKVSPETWDQFGNSVALSGETALVGSHGDNSSYTIQDSGAAYVFVRSGTTWTQQAYLPNPSPDWNDLFGTSVALSGDTALISNHIADSNASGVNGNQADNSLTDAGAAYVFVRNGTTWTQQAYLKASNPGAGDQFGYPVTLSGDTAMIGAHREDSNATGVNGNQTNDDAQDAGAAYVFIRNGTTWTQQAYLKASNAEANDLFGLAMTLSGNIAIVGAYQEDSNATGINGNQTNNDAQDAGAAYVFVRNGTTWTQQAYLKASNTEANDRLVGYSVGLSGDTALVGAYLEDSNAAGVNGDQTNNSASASGAVYVFTGLSESTVNTPTPEPTATNTPEPTATNTPEPTATNTPEPTATNTPEPTATNTTTLSTLTPVPPISTNTPTTTLTHTPTPTNTPIITPTFPTPITSKMTYLPMLIKSEIPPTPTFTPTATPTFTPTPSLVHLFVSSVNIGRNGTAEVWTVDKQQQLLMCSLIDNTQTDCGYFKAVGSYIFIANTKCGTKEQEFSDAVDGKEVIRKVTCN